MESSEQSIDLNELLIDEDDETQRISIDLRHVEDEDGDPAVTIHIQSTGLDMEGLLFALELAYETVQEALEDD